MLKTLLLLAAFGLALAGCGTSETASHRWAKQLAKTYGESNYVAWTNDKGVEFVLSGCPFLNSDGTVTFTPKPGDEYDPRDSTFRGWRHPTSCTDVAGTRDPQDSEFWRFNLYYVTQLRLYGAIPVSPTFKSDQSMKIGVVGARDACEAVRRPMDKKPRGVAGDETTHMTDPCEGPSYFRRPSLTADEG